MKEQHLVRPNAVYTPELLKMVLGLSKNTIGREVRLGRLRVTKRAGRYFVLGQWVLEWLEAGEVTRKQPSEVEVLNKR
jgi:hypothetical protein